MIPRSTPFGVRLAEISERLVHRDACVWCWFSDSVPRPVRARCESRSSFSHTKRGNLFFRHRAGRAAMLAERGRRRGHTFTSRCAGSAPLRHRLD